MDYLLRHLLKLRVTCTILIIVFLPHFGSLTIMSGSFYKDSTEGQPLEVFEKGQSRVKACAQCGFYCLKKARLDLASPCLAYTCDPVDRMCVFYKKSSAKLPSPGVQAFLLKVKDTFHTISIRGQLFTVFLSSDTKTYTEARAHCHSLGGFLLEFESQEEYEAVETVMAGETDVTKYSYVGANDLTTEGQWVTERDGTPLDPQVWTWNSGEPNDLGGEDCASVIFGDWKINDIRCSASLRYLCEKDL